MPHSARINRPQNLPGRRKQDVSDQRLSELSSGRVETTNWTEWMAADMPRLARVVARECGTNPMRQALIAAAAEAEHCEILGRLLTFGRSICAATSTFEDVDFIRLASHPSDIVRQWAVYAVNAPSRRCAIEDRLRSTLQFAADRNMTVRECAWMAFRPYVAEALPRALTLLKDCAASPDCNIRRFSVEVCRPRSVWGKHIEALKREPEQAVHLLALVNRDGSRYVRLALGNWLNDASKSRPDWVLQLCARWARAGDQNTGAIIRRGLRTLAKSNRGACARSVHRIMNEIRP